MATIKFNITNNDPVTRKRMKYNNTEIRFQYGAPIEISGAISLHEINDSPAVPAGSDSRSKKAVESYSDYFTLLDKFIDTVSLLYAVKNANDEWVLQSDGVTPVVNPVLSMAQYFEQYIINTLPGVAGGDQLWEISEGICKQMINVRKANGEFPA